VGSYSQEKLGKAVFKDSQESDEKSGHFVETLKKSGILSPM